MAGYGSEKVKVKRPKLPAKIRRRKISLPAKERRETEYKSSR